MELKTDTNPLLDRISVYGFKITNIADVDFLIDNGVATRKDRSEHYICTEYGEFYSSINIGKTALFDSLIYSIGVDGHVYGLLELSVVSDGYHNLNCYTISDYKSRIEQVKNSLLQDYGISIDFSEAKIKKLEINKTIIINDKFSSYQRPLTLLMYLLPGKLRLKSENVWIADKSKPYKASDYERAIKTYYKTSGVRGITIKVYDKTEQLEAAFGISVAHQYMRFEISLNSPAKITEALGTNFIEQLDDSCITNYYSDFVQRNIVDPFTVFETKRDIAIRKILKKHFTPGSRTWVRDVLLEIYNLEVSNQVPLLLDINELLPQLAKLKFHNKQAKNRSKNQFIKVCKDTAHVFDSGDDLRYQEIIKKLSCGACNNGQEIVP